MKKILFFFTLLTCCFYVSGQAIYSHKIQVPSTFNCVHPFFSGDSQPHFFYYSPTYTIDGIKYFSIVNQDFQVEKTFSAKLPQYSMSNNGYETTGYAYISYNMYFIENSGMEYGGELSYSFWSKSSDYEYLVPILGNSPISQGNSVWNNPIIGISVKSSTGSSICDMKFPNGYYGISYMYTQCVIVAMQGKIHVSIPVVNDSGESFNLIYELGNYSGSNKITATPKFVSVTPTYINTTDVVNVSIDGYDGQPKIIEVVSANGNILFSCKTTDNYIQIPHHLLTPGLNIVTVNVNGNIFEATKIISH